MDNVKYVNIIEFVSPYYTEKDILHGIEHIERMLYSAKEIIKAEKLDLDFTTVIYAAYFHGLASQNMVEIESFLSEYQLPPRICQIAVESLGKSQAETLEGKILSDAHTLEGGKYLRYLKPLFTGTYMHQTLDETFHFIENNVLDKGSVYFEYSKQILAQYNQGIAKIHREIKTEFRRKFFV